jgi:hypothetical protein
MIRITAVSLVTALCAIAEDAFPTPATTAPPEIVASAVAAVRHLGEQVVLGRYHVAIEKMNPMWKDRAARRAGGMASLERQLQDVPRRMLRDGVSILSSHPQGEPKVFEVSPGRANPDGSGEIIYTKWLIFVPTITTSRVIRESEPRPILFESIGFQVAVSDKEPLDWTFIDGSSVTVNELRSMFPTRPADFELPPIELREAR